MPALHGLASGRCEKPAMPISPECSSTVMALGGDAHAQQIGSMEEHRSPATRANAEARGTDAVVWPS
eukprot:4559910-Alexandrium_andersonii.AAC.1